MKKKTLSLLIITSLSIQLFLQPNYVFAKEGDNKLQETLNSPIKTLKKSDNKTENFDEAIKGLEKEKENAEWDTESKEAINSTIDYLKEEENQTDKTTMNLFRIPCLEKKLAGIVFKKFFTRKDFSTDNEKKQWNDFCEEINKNYKDTKEFEESIDATDLATNKDIKLHAYYVNNNSDTTVILQHGYNANSMALKGEAKMFLDQGYNVLLPDEYGSGLSEGNYIAFGAYGKKYINDWIDYLVNSGLPGENIILFGQSMGASTVLLSQENANKHVKAIIEDCGYANLRQELKDSVESVKVIRTIEKYTRWLIDWEGLKNNILDELNSNYIEPILNFNLNDINPIDAVKDNSIPKLFIHGTSDTLVPVYNEKKLFDSDNSGIKEQLLVKGAEHAKSFRKDKWEYENTVNKFLKFISNTKKTGLQKINDKWYYFNDNGEMQTGWQRIDGKRHYFNSNGEMQTGLQKIDDKWYYFNDNGEMQTGLQKIDDKEYYFNDNDGEMQKGWQKIDDKEYYFNDNGEMQTGWQRIDDKWCYFDNNGVLIDAKTYKLSDWMSGLGGNLKLSQLSIPGTHDSMATRSVWCFGGMGQDQSLDLDSQLNLGIRYLDIRCRYTKGSFAIHHGKIFEHKMFGDVLNTVKDFLDNHPNETIFMRIKQEDSNVPDETFNKTFMEYVNSYPNLFWNNNGDNKQDPTLNSMRGKIVVLYNVAGLNFGLDYAHGIFKIQDNYKDNVNKKIADASNFIREADTKNNSNAYLNYLSEENNGKNTDSVASKINSAISSDLEANEGKYKYVGILAADFPDQNLIRHIVDVNYNKNWIDIPDEKLKSALNEALKQKPDAFIFKDQLAGLKGTLDLSNKGITNLEGLQYCTNITELDLQNNKISDVTKLANLTNLTNLKIYNNNISDLSPLKGLKKITYLGLKPQNPVFNEVDTIAYNLTIKNPLVDIDGNPVIPTNISNGGVYDDKTNTITFNNIKFADTTVTFDFQKEVKLGSDKANFTGTATQKIKYNRGVKIPDAKLRAALNEKLGQKADDPITENQLVGLKGTLDLSNKGITNLEGLQDCINITELDLQNNKISDVTKLANLTNLTNLKIYNNNISDLSPLKGLKKITYLGLKPQNPILNEVNSIESSLTIKNPLVDIDGNPVIPTNISNGGVYDDKTNTITFNNISKDETVTFDFRKEVKLGSDKANFTGTVTQKIKYTKGEKIPDAKLRAALNEKLGQKADAPIIRNQLAGLKGTLDLSNKGITNLEELQYCTNITKLNLEGNSIDNLQTLYYLLENKYNMQAFAGPSDENFFNTTSQKIVLPEVIASGNLVIKNPLKDVYGRPIKPTNISNGGIYNNEDNTITFNNINKDTTVTFSFDSPIVLECRYGYFTMGKFSGTVTQKIKYTKGEKIPDAKLRAALNEKLGQKADAPIIRNQLAGLKGTLDLSNKGITNLEGLQYCTNIDRLKLNRNNISDITPLSHLYGLVELHLDNNKISDISSLPKISNIKTSSPRMDFSSLKILTLENQEIKGKEVTSVGSKVTVKNIVKAPNGNLIVPSKSKGYTYDAKTGDIIFNNITQTGNQSYNFNVNFGIGTFSGRVTQNVKYNSTK